MMMMTREKKRPEIISSETIKTFKRLMFVVKQTNVKISVMRKKRGENKITIQRMCTIVYVYLQIGVIF